MFDLHAHILPSVDDGPADLEEALTVLTALARAGVHGIVATPRFCRRYPRLAPEDLHRRARALERLARHAGLSLRIWAGHEVSLNTDIERHLARGAIATVNDGPYVLCDLPTLALPAGLPGVIARLRRDGYIPVLAHPERCTVIRRDPDALVPLVEAGALTQLTLSSLTGSFGPGVRRTAETLLRHNLAHALASGTHSLKDHPSRVAVALRAAELLAGRERVRQMTVDVPRAIIEGLPVAVSGGRFGMLPGDPLAS